MTDVAVIGFAQSPVRWQTMPALPTAWRCSCRSSPRCCRAPGLTKNDIGFWCSGSSDYLAGRAFSFVSAVDAIGAVPPVAESHVEMDAAWALYEAWVKILIGDADIALAYGFGKSSAGDLRRVLALQLDPYLLAPLWPDSVSIAALQARLGIEAGLWSEADMADVAARNRAAAVANPRAQLSGEVSAEKLLGQPYVADPLRAHDCAPVGDGAAVVILASAERASELRQRPAWITGFEHRIDSAALGARDLTRGAVGGRRRRVRREPPASTPPSCTRRSPIRRSCCAARSASVTTSASTRPAACSAATPCSPPGWPGSGGPRRRSCPAARAARSATPPAGRPCSRTSSA